MLSKHACTGQIVPGQLPSFSYGWETDITCLWTGLNPNIGSLESFISTAQADAPTASTYLISVKTVMEYNDNIFKPKEAWYIYWINIVQNSKDWCFLWAQSQQWILSYSKDTVMIFHCIPEIAHTSPWKTFSYEFKSSCHSRSKYALILPCWRIEKLQDLEKGSGK